MPSIRIVALAVALLTGLCLAPAGVRATPVVKISSENSPAHFQVQVLENFADLLNERLGDRVTFAVHHSGSLYRGRDVVDALAAGRADIAAPGVWHLSRHVQDFAVLQLPALYGRTAEEVGDMVDSRLGDMLAETLEARLDVHILGRWLDLGHAHLFTTDATIRSPDDLEGLRIRVAGGAGNRWRINQLGADAVVIPWPDFPSVLRDGLVTGTLSTPMSVASARLWEAGIEAVILDYEYYPYYVPMISGTVWRRLTPPERTLIEQTWDDVVTDGRRLARTAQAKALHTLEEHGVTIIRPDKETLAAIRRRLVADQDDLVQSLEIDPQLVHYLSDAPP